ncbi:hypothetical protein NQ315_015155 [Exocentrus adspersus]|uniref:Endonuclease/exonuclease/phosphatase domain-containing protein n=1 Tax=Exocentrus adspersus TaxID=1586481 RepID=A0AAV8VEN8_9CUCU|nr:hypothetical protein NQ315_015155 [Exocentrus adspersus]
MRTHNADMHMRIIQRGRQPLQAGFELATPESRHKPNGATPSTYTRGYQREIGTGTATQLNSSGAALWRFLENTVDVAAIGPIEPTFNGQGRFAPDVLDIASLKAIPAETDITSHHEGSSDHNPVLITMGDPAPRRHHSQEEHGLGELPSRDVKEHRHPANRDRR